ncbi:hypothetical protein GIB67_033487 [Kingdonia uniflora]|uniref:Uncharacterized protein n=1 Tax=Kingdonia uniflora TaxID=39325 RepID=A0A7J7L661_9MAGN|nr:hypothetical protein GIB67_033487 [Kingdonia uniflora]
MAESSATSSPVGGDSLKDQGNEFFKAGNYLKAAALYTQAIKKDPSNATLYRRAGGGILFTDGVPVLQLGTGGNEFWWLKMVVFAPCVGGFEACCAASKLDLN